MTRILAYLSGALAFVGALFYFRGNIHKAKRKAAEKTAQVATKRHEHSDAVSRADREAREAGRRKSREAAKKARSGDRTHFE